MNAVTTYLQPGEILVTQKPEVVTTILGSCISVCLFAKSNNTAGMNHYLLPQYLEDSQDLGRFGDSSIRLLIEKIKRTGVKSNELVAKIFGGAKIVNSNLPIFDTGVKNALIARAILTENNIPILIEDVGGDLGRRIEFNTLTGKVMVTYLKNQIK